MKPTSILLLLVMLCACNQQQVDQTKGSCNGNTILNMSIGYNNITRTSINDSKGRVRLIFMGVTSTVFLLTNEIAVDGMQPYVMVQASVPAADRSPGLYYSDSTDHMAAQMNIDTTRYYCTDFKLNISTLGRYKPSGDVAEYSVASGSYTGTFFTLSGKDSLHVTGEFCMDMPEVH